MKSEITKPDTTTVKVTVALTASDLSPFVDRTYNKLRQSVKAAGFRPGKAPNEVIERQVGANTVQSEVLELAIETTYAEAAKKEKLDAIASPQVTIVKFVPYSELEYTAEVAVLPEIKLPDYKKIKKSQPKVEVSDKEVDAFVADLRRQAATPKKVERAVKKGDMVKIDYVGTKAEVAFEGGSAQGYQLVVGEGSFIPGFEDNLIGMKAGQTKKFPITFPKDYAEATLAGQKTEFEVKLVEVQELDQPELDEKFMERFGFKELAPMKAAIKQQIEQEKAQQARLDFEVEVVDEIAAKSKFEVPKMLIDSQLERMKQDMEQNLAASGLDLAKYLQIRKQTAEELDREMRPEAERRVRRSMALTEIARAESVKVSDDDIEAEVARLKLQYNDPETLRELDHDHTRIDIYNQLLGTRTIAKIMEYVEAK